MSNSMEELEQFLNGDDTRKTISDKLAVYVELRAEKKDLDDKLKAVNESIGNAKAELKEAIEQQGGTSFATDNLLVVLQKRKHFSVSAPSREDVYPWFEDRFGKDVFTIHSRTFDALCREVEEEGGGDSLPNGVSVFEEDIVSIRKKSK